ncbi:hypothetical protein LOD99_12085 [Oopsacas minuta]|uniref:Uncharacterized protein n=1 Tax=Oopsacas minuta TaxID=111878 RepID=A0AAV7JHR6_9METZ|nr:hypothetical protein LOD99_12085 [Oopsacas minuta]
MNSNRAKVRSRRSGAGYKRQRKECDAQNKIGAVELQRFLVPVQHPPQNTGQERVIPDPPLEDNGSVESDIGTRSDPDPSETIHECESGTHPRETSSKTLEPGPLLSQTHYEWRLFIEDPSVSRTKMDPSHSSKTTQIKVEA